VQALTRSWRKALARIENRTSQRSAVALTRSRRKPLARIENRTSQRSAVHVVTRSGRGPRAYQEQNTGGGLN
jgi:hypothetical protein